MDIHVARTTQPSARPNADPPGRDGTLGQVVPAVDRPAPADSTAPVAGCPKRMVFGPCGGVRSAGGCEMADHPCVFLGPGRTLPEWREPQRPGELRPPLVLTDLSVPAGDAATLTATARLLAPTCDAMLVGDHQDRPDFPPTQLAGLIAAAGGRPWVTLACRDRNRIVLEQELRGLQLAGAAAVLCVTGDGRAFDVRPDVTQVFDLDGTRLTALAAAMGVPAGVAETPTAPPVDARPARLVQKQRAGAAVAVLNHVSDPASVGRFVAATRGQGLTIPVIAAVAVFTDARSAAVLDALPGLEIDRDVVAAVLAAPDPVTAGIEAAVAEARSLLAIDGVHGVNLSGLASDRGVRFAAEVQAEIGRRIREEVPHARAGG
ncbi:methylenetetrahydrofolate reductase C-terminal domain-containing protein [Nakamurella leprariae]|uniref:Methylenetetrahydrofolate reductase n=1 Tax=Nakamurella leprariae TaxID=2803911 RepID=A0A938YH96_9ACTN|nr:methylenetetrahydrofolate reductase C-terminal domain-containing protein [Nakamurella leprariae]MBM9467780.1 methylenetetrahydrofolate reductase C-terminal domain-containing protein [Nakamurella leprariae]